MLIYYLLPIFAFFGFIIAIKDNEHKVFSFFCFSLLLILFIVIAGFRNEQVSRDYENYVDFFNQIVDGNTVSVIDDPGFYYIIKFVKLFSNKYAYLFLVYAILGVSFKFFSFIRINGIKGSFLAIMIYSSNFFFLHEMTQIRIGVATGIFLLSLKYIIEQNFKFYLLFIVLGMFFHVSLIIVLPLYFINYKTIKPIFWLSLIFFNLIFYISKFSILNILQLISPAYFSEKIYVYKSFMLDSNDTTNIGIFNRFLLYLILNIFLLYNWKILKNKSQFFILLLKCSFISLSIAFFLYDFYLFAYRFSEIIGVVQICLFAMIGFLFKDKIFGSAVVLLISLFLILVNISLTGLLQNYKFINLY